MKSLVISKKNSGHLYQLNFRVGPTQKLFLKIDFDRATSIKKEDVSKNSLYNK